jgi:tyrosine-protein kinase Etk/Wzc
VNTFLIYLWNRKWIIGISSLLIIIWAYVCAFYMTTREYKASVTFLPPSESTTATAIMGMTLMSGTSIMYDQVEIVFNSAALKRRIIEQFNLYDKWKLTKDAARFESALERMKKYVLFKSTSKGSMGLERIISYTITCYHTSPDTAKMMCDFAFSIIDSSVKTLSSGLAHRNRQFVETHLAMHRKLLDSMQQEFKKFQLTHKAFVVPEQMRLSLRNYADIKSAAILNELKIKAVKQEFHGTLPQLEELETNDELYRQQLSQIESDTRPDVLPSLELSATLLPQYLNLARDIEVENQVLAMLTKEFEQARVQESRNISLLNVIDPPYVPNQKARPSHTLVFALIFVSLEAVMFLLLSYQCYFSTVVWNHGTFRSLLQAIKSSKR